MFLSTALKNLSTMEQVYSFKFPFSDHDGVLVNLKGTEIDQVNSNGLTATWIQRVTTRGELARFTIKK